MHFLSPFFWIAALATAVPIILHLVRREDSVRVPFASLMFLGKIPKREMGRQRLKYLFLLVLRCLGVLLLVSAFARPVVTHGWVRATSFRPARSVIILVDHSLSMSRRPTWERAVKAVETKIESLSGADEAMILQFGEAVEVLSPWEKEAGRLRTILENRVSTSFESTSYLEGLRVAADQFSRAHPGKKEIHLITDLQRQGLNKGSKWALPADIDLQVEDVGSETSNVFVQEVRLAREVFGGTYPHPILVRLGNTSPEVVRGEAQLFLEGELIDRRSFEVAGSGQGIVTFEPFQLGEGVRRGKIVIEPTDILPSDNTFFFVVERRNPQNVTLFSDPGKTSFYFKNALAAGRNLPFRVQPAPGADWTLVRKADTPVIVLDSLSQPPRLSLFERYVEEGGSLVLALGNRVRADAYNRLWGRFLAVELIGRNFVRTQKVPFTSITEVRWEHPVFAIFRGLHREAILSSQFYGYWKLAPKEDAVVLARFSEGDPALIERRWGRGKLFVFASSLDPIWTDFPLRSAYVPFWYRLIEYAAGWQVTSAAMTVNQVLPVERWRAQASSQTGSGVRGLNVLDPGGRRVLKQDEEKTRFIPLKSPGHYEIRANKKTDWVAANCEPSESDLTPVSLEEFLATFASGAARNSQTRSLHKSAQEKETGRAFWWLFLVGAALILGVEAVVANRFYGERQHRLVTHDE